MNLASTLNLSFWLLLAASLAGLINSRGRWSWGWGGLASLGSLGLVAAGWMALVLPPQAVPAANQALGLQWPGPISLAGMAGWFLILLGASGFLTAFFSIDYTRHAGYDQRITGFLFPLVIASLAVVAVEANLLWMLAAWELAAVAAYLLVATGHDRQATGSALLMLLLSELGTLAAAAILVYVHAQSGSWYFAAAQTAMLGLPAATRGVIFLVLFFGFGVKAGLIPLHTWLPAAHPAAPANFSALLSTAIVSMGVFLVSRSIQLVGRVPQWTLAIVILVAAATALYGALYAVMETDLKRLLAFSTMENMGIALSVLGAGWLFKEVGLAAAAGLAISAGLFHLLNHAVFKAVLFMGAGWLDQATGTRNLSDYGGALLRAPWLSVTWLICALAIAAIPPLSGFASEWLALQSLLQAFQVEPLGLRLVVITAGVVLALTAGLVVTAFIRAFTVVFTGAPRRDVTLEDTSGTARWSTVLGTAAVILTGMLPPVLVPLFARAASALSDVNVASTINPPLFIDPGASQLLVSLGGRFLAGWLPIAGPVIIPPAAGFSAVSSTYMWVALPLLLVLALVIRKLWSRSQRHDRQASANEPSTRLVPTWTGGSSPFEASVQYTAPAYSVPERELFSGLYNRTSGWQVTEGEGYFPARIDYQWEVLEWLDHHLYRPAIQLVLGLARGIQQVHTGRVNLYTGYLLAALLLVYLFAS